MTRAHKRGYDSVHTYHRRAGDPRPPTLDERIAGKSQKQMDFDRDEAARINDNATDPSEDYRVSEGDDQGEIKGY